MKIVAVSGVDGAGKSTFIRELEGMLRAERPDIKVASAWMRFNPRARVGRDGSGPVSTLDASHRGHPAKRALRRVHLTSLWAGPTRALYARQLRWQLGALSAHDVVIADRFSLDYAADLIGSGMLPESQARRFLSGLPAPDIQFVLTASNETLDQRRDARENHEALCNRRDLYLRLAEAGEAAVIDTLDASWRQQVGRVMQLGDVA